MNVGTSAHLYLPYDTGLLEEEIFLNEVNDLGIEGVFTEGNGRFGADKDS